MDQNERLNLNTKKTNVSIEKNYETESESNDDEGDESEPIKNGVEEYDRMAKMIDQLQATNNYSHQIHAADKSTTETTGLQTITDILLRNVDKKRKRIETRQNETKKKKGKVAKQIQKRSKGQTSVNEREEQEQEEEEEDDDDDDDDEGDGEGVAPNHHHEQEHPQKEDEKSKKNIVSPLIEANDLQPEAKSKKKKKNRHLKCKITGCSSLSRGSKGVCFKHSTSEEKIKLAASQPCTVSGCTTSRRGGFKTCFKHSKALCKFPNCTKRGRLKGFCCTHAGSCIVPGCKSKMRSQNRCFKHRNFDEKHIKLLAEWNVLLESYRGTHQGNEYQESTKPDILEKLWSTAKALFNLDTNFRPCLDGLNASEASQISKTVLNARSSLMLEGLEAAKSGAYWKNVFDELLKKEGVSHLHSVSSSSSSSTLPASTSSSSSSSLIQSTQAMVASPSKIQEIMSTVLSGIAQDNGKQELEKDKKEKKQKEEMEMKSKLAKLAQEEYLDLSRTAFKEIENEKEKKEMEMKSKLAKLGKEYRKLEKLKQDLLKANEKEREQEKEGEKEMEMKMEMKSKVAKKVAQEEYHNPRKKKS